MDLTRQMSVDTSSTSGEGPAGATKRSRRSMTPSRFRAITTVPLLAVMALFILYSFGYLGVMAFRDAGIFNPEQSSFVGMKTIEDVLGTRRMIEVIGNTLMWISVSVIVTVAAGVGTGIYLSKSTKVTKLAQAFMLLPWVLPGIVVAALWKWAYSTNTGLLNDLLSRLGLVSSPVSWLGEPSIALFAVCAVIVWRLFPLFGLVVASAIQTIPAEIYDAAHVDGATSRQVLWRITLPLVRSHILTMALLVTIWIANNLVFVQAMTGGGPAGATETLPVYIYSLMFDSYSLSQASVVSLINILLLVLIGAAYMGTLARHRTDEE